MHLESGWPRLCVVGPESNEGQGAMPSPVRLAGGLAVISCSVRRGLKLVNFLTESDVVRHYPAG